MQIQSASRGGRRRRTSGKKIVDSVHELAIEGNQFVRTAKIATAMAKADTAYITQGKKLIRFVAHTKSLGVELTFAMNFDTRYGMLPFRLAILINFLSIRMELPIERGTGCFVVAAMVEADTRLLSPRGFVAPCVLLYIVLILQVQVRLLLSINNYVEFKIFIIQDAAAWSMNSGLIAFESDLAQTVLVEAALPNVTKENVSNWNSVSR
ncbi:unnamed protein product [Citrullus colocynthis]|uniref:Uncharacterized protein n=1 Tax=Citrullus colocynthis TaxID=252529 RepID=A0ABP0Y5M1_9ROSI